jgi:hypothetical protein
MSPSKALAAALAVGLTAGVGRADDGFPPFAVTDRPAVLRLEDGRSFSIPPSYILAKPEYEKLDAELKRLKEFERLETAEPDPGWLKPYLVVGGVGIVLGIVGTVFAMRTFTPSATR